MSTISVLRMQISQVNRKTPRKVSGDGWTAPISTKTKLSGDTMNQTIGDTVRTALLGNQTVVGMIYVAIIQATSFVSLIHHKCHSESSLDYLLNLNEEISVKKFSLPK